ncbi:MAG: hypothetical protein JWQ65_2578 [Devosia sp.]|nr:hypothetical protein [Devosia sp.]
MAGDEFAHAPLVDLALAHPPRRLSLDIFWPDRLGAVPPLGITQSAFDNRQPHLTNPER